MNTELVTTWHDHNMTKACSKDTQGVINHREKIISTVEIAWYYNNMIFI